MKDFEVGAVVTLNSGGKPMTVVESAFVPAIDRHKYDLGVVSCVYFDSGSAVQWGFPVECLKHYRPFWKFWR